MRLIPPIRFAGSADSSRTATPEPEDRPSSPDSVHSDTEAKEHLSASGSTAKDLLKRGVISPKEYDLLTGGIDRAHLAIRQKTGLARAWQSHSKGMERQLDQVWDDLNETEEQLAAVQQHLDTSESQLGIVQKALIRAISAPGIYKQTNSQIIQENVRLKRELIRLAPPKTEVKQKLQGNSAKMVTEAPKRISDQPEKLPFHLLPLEQRLLRHNKAKAEQAAQQAESSGSR